MRLPDFPIRKQPHAFGCLPTCVQAVLSHYGENISYEEASEWCRELPQGGCFWSDAVEGLREGYTVEEITTGEETPDEAMTKLRQFVEADNQVVIAEISFKIELPGHAVVVTEFMQSEADAEPTLSVVYMDPERGEILQMLAATFLKKWQHRDYQAFYIPGE